MALTNGSFTDTITPGDGNRVYISKQHLKEIRDYLIAHFGKSGLNDTDPNLTHPIATATKPGFLSVADKALLDNLAANAGTVLSVSGQAPITSSGGTNPSIGISAATGGTPGSMSAADKTKLDTYPASYSTISSAIGTKGPGTVTEVKVKIDGNEEAIVATSTSTPVISLPNASTNKSGLMSKEDKAKIDGLMNVPLGGIIMWSPTAGEITTYFDVGTGLGKPGADMSDWALCDGKNGTPNMTGRFPFSAGTVNPGTTGGVQKVKLKPAELPLHRHAIGQFDQCGNNDMYIEACDNNHFPDKTYTFEAVWLAGDETAYRGGVTTRGWQTDCLTRTWTSKRMFDADTEAQEEHENMPPYIALWFIQRIH